MRKMKEMEVSDVNTAVFLILFKRGVMLNKTADFVKAYVMA